MRVGSTETAPMLRVAAAGAGDPAGVPGFGMNGRKSSGEGNF
jgi:hypothetical protein